jgi:hypothetical protein
MTKGFGTPINKKLGYVLNLVSEFNIYAAAENALPPLDKDEADESSAGITNDLSMARVWKNPRQAEKSVQDYLGFLVDWMTDGNLDELTILICALKADNKGDLTTEVAQKMRLEKDKTKSNS